MADIVKAVENPPEYTSSLPPEQPPSRVLDQRFQDVCDTDRYGRIGKVIHDDTWGSSYAAVNGQLLIGGAPPKPQTLRLHRCRPRLRLP